MGRIYQSSITTYISVTNTVFTPVFITLHTVCTLIYLVISKTSINFAAVNQIHKVMRTLIITLLLSLHINMANAEEYTITPNFESDESTSPDIRHAPAKMPSISQDDDIFTISRISRNSEVHVYLLNKEGDTLYNYIGTSPDGTLTLEIPATISEDIVQVILKVNNKTYIGHKQQ